MQVCFSLSYSINRQFSEKEILSAKAGIYALSEQIHSNHIRTFN